MNALTWFKEWARRSQTADAMAGVREQAHADASRTFQTLIQQDQDREKLAAHYGRLIDQERLQQAGQTERTTITQAGQTKRSAAAAAAAAAERARTQANTDFDDAKGLEEETALRGFAKLKGIAPDITEALVLNLKAKNAQKAPPIDRELNGTVAGIRGIKTVEGLKAAVAAIPEKYRDHPLVAQAIAGALGDAAVAAGVREDVHRKRWAPPQASAGKTDTVTDAEMNSLSKRREEILRKLEGEQNPEVKAFLESDLRRVKARMSTASGATGGKNDAFAAAMLGILEGFKKPEPKKKP